MTIDVRQVATNEGAIAELHHVRSQFHPHFVVPVYTTGPQRHGVWKVTNRTSAGTTIITSPDGEGAIIVTDMIVSTDKTAGSSVQLQFTDDTDTEIMALFDSTNAPVAMAIALVGQLRGWKDARLEIVTVNSVNATITLGYMKVPEGLPFAEWDALR